MFNPLLQPMPKVQERIPLKTTVSTPTVLNSQKALQTLSSLTSNELNLRYYNAGNDCFLRGRLLSENPFKKGCHQWSLWNLGWLDAEIEWIGKEKERNACNRLLNEEVKERWVWSREHKGWIMVRP